MTRDPWRLPDPRRAPPGVELLGLSAGLTPQIALAGYRSGLFVMELEAGIAGWFSPDPRGILPLDRLHVSRSLRRSMIRFEVTFDSVFDEVVAACADPSRPGAWITPEYREVYRALHHAGAAHSVEVWSQGELAGGLFGVEQGGLFCGESMFHWRTDASKVAVAALVDVLRSAEGRSAEGLARILDVQWWTPHLGSLGVVAIPRSHYLDMLPAALSLPPAFGAIRTR